MFAILWQTFCCVRLIILEIFYGQQRLWGICPTDIFPSSRSSDMGRSYGITFTFYYEQHPPSLLFRNICAVFQFQKMDCVRRFGVWNIGEILWWHAGTNTDWPILTNAGANADQAASAERDCLAFQNAGLDDRHKPKYSVTVTWEIMISANTDSAPLSVDWKEGPQTEWL